MKDGIKGQLILESDVNETTPGGDIDTFNENTIIE
jgi:hypothetical protein